jgi:hypothetical protein
MTHFTERHAQRLARSALVTAVGYGLLRTYWLVNQPPKLSPIGPDLIVPDGWGLALCILAAVLAVTLGWRGASRRQGTALVAISAVVSVALVVVAALFVFDLVGGVFRGMGIDFFALGAASRVVCIGTGVLLGLATRGYWLRNGLRSPFEQRIHQLTTPLSRTPEWAYWAAYISVAGCLTRIVAQATVGFGSSPLTEGGSAEMFEVCFLLAGTLLPLALVHSWGRTWPRWVVGLSGRRVPRWLVLGPGIAVSSIIIIYFGTMLVEMIFERLHGRNPFPPDDRMALPETFFWVAVPAYFVWGVGLAIATLSYRRRTSEGAESLLHGMAATASEGSLAR